MVNQYLLMHLFFRVGDKQKGEGEEGGWIWPKYIICMYENSTVKHIKKYKIKEGWQERDKKK
jgi:hypothetical protein